MIEYTEFVSDFLDCFFLMTKKQQKHFKYLHWFCKNMRTPVITMEEQVKASKACDSTIRRWRVFYQKKGWLKIVRRAGLPSLYYINEEILNLDLSNKKLLRK